MQKQLSILNLSQRCRHLQSKGMYINFNQPAGEEVAGDGHLWCGRSQSSFGPDNESCGREECIDPERSCYAPL